MRRAILLSIGAVEALVAAVLAVAGSLLPRPESVSQTFNRVGTVSHRAEKQVQLMRQQVGDIRQQDLPRAVDELRSQTRNVSSNLKNNRIDFQTVAAISDALSAISSGLDVWSNALDPLAGGGKSGELLDDRLASSTNQAASSLDELAANLERDIRRALYLFETPGDARNSHEIDIILERCRSNLELLSQLLRDERFRATRDAYRDLEPALTTAIRQVELFGETVIPALKSKSLPVPAEETDAGWVEGKQIAAGLRRALASVSAINREFDEIDRLPPMTADCLDRDETSAPVASQPQRASRSDRTAGPRNQALDDKLNRMPDEARRLAALRPGLARLRALAESMRNAQAGIHRALPAWPAFVETLHRSSTALHGSRKHLDTILGYKDQYERAVKSSVQLLETTEDVLHSYTTKLDVRLGEQEYSLGQMQDGLKEVNESLPLASESTNEFVRTLRWILWLTGGLIGLHGVLIGASGYAKQTAAAGPIDRCQSSGGLSKGK